jgi:hypothetical protein
MPENRKLSLFEAFASIPDPRHSQGCRHSLQAILAMTSAALLSGCQSVEAIAEWGRVNLASNRPLFLRFGFTSYTSPAHSTLYEVFAAIDITRVEQILAQWVAGLLPSTPLARISLDGKTLRGSQKKTVEAPGVHLLSAFRQQGGCTLRQLRVADKTNEPKAAVELLAQLLLDNAVITGDAIFCQKELCAQITEQRGDYFFVVKDNQPALKEACAEAFKTPVSPLGAAVVAG